MNSDVYTYAELYHIAFTAADKIAWVTQELRRIDGLCLTHHQRALKRLHILCTTQSMFKCERFEPIQYAIGTAIANAQRARQHRTRRLIRRMLCHVYSPGGRMMRQTMARCPFVRRP